MKTLFLLFLLAFNSIIVSAQADSDAEKIKTTHGTW